MKASEWVESGFGSSEPVLPVGRFAAEGHDGEDPDIGGALDVDDAVGKFSREMPAGGFPDETEGAGVWQASAIRRSISS